MILHYLIAFSGGLDSTVALHLFKDVKEIAEIRVRAVHIHHGLSPYADQWTQHCQSICRAWNIPLIVEKITLDQPMKTGLEDTARTLRYEALARFLEEDEILITGHHQNDQAETFLLQAVRGSGPRGLSAMPKLKPFSKGWHWRPLLDESREAIEKYARENNLSWIEDESNASLQFDRNFIRHEILPKLESRWPKSVEALARSAEIQAEICEYMDGQAEKILQNIPTALENLAVHPHYKRPDTLLDQSGAQLQRRVYPNAFPLSLLSTEEPPMQNWCLKKWLRDQTGINISKDALHHIINEVIFAGEDKQPKYKLGDFCLRRYANALWIIPNVALVPVGIHPIIPGIACPLPDGSTIKIEFSTDQAFTKNTRFFIRFRENGELFHAANQTHQKPLKQLFQEWRIPPWERKNIPLIYAEDKLIAVGDFAVAKHYDSFLPKWEKPTSP